MPLTFRHRALLPN